MSPYISVLKYPLRNRRSGSASSLASLKRSPLVAERRSTMETGMNGRLKRKDPSGISTRPRSSAACLKVPHARPTSPCSTMTSPRRSSIVFRSPHGTRLRVRSARRCRCHAVSVDRSIAVSRERCLCDGHFVANLRSTGCRISEMPEEPILPGGLCRIASSRGCTMPAARTSELKTRSHSL